jgi:polyhydroxybutyrate depolymerase
VAFISKLVSWLVARGVADRRKVFITGHSNGGMMSLRLLCETPDQFKAVAAVSANLPVAQTCNEKSRTAVLNIVGTADKVVPFEGGSVAGRPRLGFVTSSPRTLDSLSRRNDCDGTFAERNTNRVKSDNTSLTELGANGCTAPVTQIRILGGGHAWPGSRRSETREIDAGKFIVRYFRALTSD